MYTEPVPNWVEPQTSYVTSQLSKTNLQLYTNKSIKVPNLKGHWQKSEPQKDKTGHKVTVFVNHEHGQDIIQSSARP